MSILILLELGDVWEVYQSFLEPDQESAIRKLLDTAAPTIPNKAVIPMSAGFTKFFQECPEEELPKGTLGVYYTNDDIVLVRKEV